MEALVGLFLGAIATYFILVYIKKEQSKQKINVQSVVLMEKIRKVCKLITVEGEFAEIYHHEDVKERFLSLVTSKKKAIILINAKVHVGYDLSKVRMEADNESKTIRLTAFPEPEVLSIDTDFKYYDKKDGLFNKFETSDLTELNSKAKEHVLAKVPQSGLLETARNEALQAVLMMQTIVETIGWKLDYQDLLVPGNKMELDRNTTKKLLN